MALITHVTLYTQSFQLELIMKLISGHVAESMNRDDACRCSQLSHSHLSPFRRLLCAIRSALQGPVGGLVALESVQHATAAASQTCHHRVAQIFPKSRHHFRTLGARRKFRIEDRQLLGAKMYSTRDLRSRITYLLHGAESFLRS